jgi:uncharacterized protein (DUF427 family)
MGLAWQQGPLAPGATGTFLVPEPLPARLLYAEPLRRRMGVMFGGRSIAESDDVVLLHEPGRYPVAYFPKGSILQGALATTDKRTEHPDLGEMTWFEVTAGDKNAPRGAWEHTALQPHCRVLEDHVAFAWRAMDSFYEEAERIVGHASDPYHRIDIRQSDRHMAVSSHGTKLVETDRAIVLYESGFAPRWYVPRRDIADGLLTPVQRETFCPFKGICSYYDVGDAHQAAWAYLQPFREVNRIDGYLSFEPDKLEVTIDGQRLEPEPGQHVVSHGPDRSLTTDEAGVGALPESLRPIGVSA